MLERVHRRLKDAIRAQAPGANWVSELPWILLGLQAQPREDTGVSAAESVFGAPLVLPGQYLHQQEPPQQKFFEQLRLAMSGFQLTPAHHNLSGSAAAPVELPADLLQADFVFVRRDGHVPVLAQLYDGPYTVLARSRETFQLWMGSRCDNISTSQQVEGGLASGGSASW